MRAGPLRHTLSIYDPAGAADSDPDIYGQPNDAATLHATMRCAIRPLRGQELYIAHREHAEVSHEIRMRYVSGVLPRMYGVDENSTEYDFLSVIDVGARGKGLLIYAKERV